MPQLLSELNLQEIHDVVAQGFFNELEKTFEQQVLNSGPGYYRCVYSNTDGGLISVNNVTEITEDVYEQLHDRVIVNTEEFQILYVLFT